MTVSTFYGATPPATGDGGPDSAVNLAVRFTVSVAGWITHIRYWKSAANTGTHVVHLWETGAIKTTDTALVEVDDAWNEVALSVPFAISTGIEYMASYHTEVGHYAVDAHYFDSAVTSGALTGPITAGKFGYGDASTFPSSDFNNGSYGVDVRFTDVDPAGGITATLNVTEAADTLAAIAAAAIAATSTIAEAGDTLTATAAAVIAAVGTMTEANDVVAAVAGVGISATVAIIESGDSLASTARLSVVAVLIVTEDADTLVASASGAPLAGITATLLVTEGNDRLVSHARIVTPGALLTLAEIIPAILNDLVEGRVWQGMTPDDLPRDASKRPLPFVIWHRVGGQDDTYVEQSPLPSHRHARIQIASNAPGSIVAERLCEAVMRAMTAPPYNAGVYGSPVGAVDAARKLHAPWQQFSIWFQPNP